MEVDYKLFLRALGIRIKELRRQRGWSHRDMLVKHNVNDSQWRKYERGGGLTLESLLKIAALFEFSIVELLDDLSEYPKKTIREIDRQNASKKPAKSVPKQAGRPPKKQI